MKIGANTITNCKIGNVQVKEVRIGSTLVWSYSSFDPDAQLFITNAAITDTTQQNAVNNLVVALKGYGIWTKMKAIYPFVGGTASQHKFNLKNPLDTDAAFRLVFSGGWTHSNTGALPNGTNAFANTFFLPSNLQQNNNAIGFYARTNIIAAQTEMGVSGDAANGQINMGSNFSPVGAFARNFSPTFGGFTNSDTRGFYINSRILSTENELYKNNALLGTVSANSNTPNSTIYFSISGEMNTGNTTVRYYSSKQFAFAFMGDGLNSTEASNYYTAVQAFQTSLARNI